MINGKSGQHLRTERLNILALPPMHIVSKLVDRFFSETGILFPYIHKRSIDDGIVDISSHGFRGIRRSWLCLLNVIMAFAMILTPLQDDQIEGVVSSETFLQRSLKLLPPVWLQPANIEIRQLSSRKDAHLLTENSSSASAAHTVPSGYFKINSHLQFPIPNSASRPFTGSLL